MGIILGNPITPLIPGNTKKAGNLITVDPRKLERKNKLTQREIAELWILRKGDPTKADEASAVSMAESSGKTKVRSYSGCCYGIYQFHKDYFPLKCALNPVCSTDMAIKHSKNGTSWGIWEAHTDGSYKKYLGKSGISHSSSQGFQFAPQAGGEAAVDAVGHSIGDVVNFVARLFEPSFWLRVGKGLLGFLLLLFGALTLMKVLTGVDIPIAPATRFMRSVNGGSA